MTIQFAVRNRWTGEVQFTAEIDCAEDAPRPLKLGMAVRWGIKAGADLTGANLAYADLARADLADADLAGANLAGANLTYADLARADLADADLAGANLAGANLTYANLAYANLAYANLARANLTRANLAGANLTGAAYINDRIIDGGLRSDGYRFLLTRTDPGEWRVKAGCRNFTLTEAKAHWKITRGGTPLGDETFAIIDHMTRIAALRDWPAQGEEPAAKAAESQP